MNFSKMNNFKLPKSALHFLIPLFLSCAMSGIVSFISLIRSQGLADFMIISWFYSWMFSWFIAFPSVLLLLPLTRYLLLKLVKSDNCR
ncbi:DUF2798 domain-containing protein [Morganella morganii]|nr:DUF2798 domain-containing protein [Morganella morganii]